MRSVWYTVRVTNEHKHPDDALPWADEEVPLSEDIFDAGVPAGEPYDVFNDPYLTRDRLEDAGVLTPDEFPIPTPKERRSEEDERPDESVDPEALRALLDDESGLLPDAESPPVDMNAIRSVILKQARGEAAREILWKVAAYRPWREGFKNAWKSRKV